MMQQILNQYRLRFGDVTILGGQIHDGPLPTEPDTFVVSTCLLVCKKNSIKFDSHRDDISYGIDVLAGERIGACRIKIKSPTASDKLDNSKEQMQNIISGAQIAAETANKSKSNVSKNGHFLLTLLATFGGIFIAIGVLTLFIFGLVLAALLAHYTNVPTQALPWLAILGTLLVIGGIFMIRRYNKLLRRNKSTPLMKNEVKTSAVQQYAPNESRQNGKKIEDGGVTRSTISNKMDIKQETGGVSLNVRESDIKNHLNIIRNKFNILENAYVASNISTGPKEMAEIEKVLSDILSEGDIGLLFLLERIMKGVTFSGNNISLYNWGEDTTNELIKKQIIIKALGAAKVKGALSELEKLAKANCNYGQWRECIIGPLNRAITAINGK